MHFKQAGYHAALVDLGLIKEAAKAGILKRIFSRSPKAAPVPMQGQNFGPQISGIADDSAANAFRSQMNATSATSQSPLLKLDDTVSRFGTSPQSTLNNIQGLKNTGSLPVTAPSPAGVAPSSFTPAAAAGNRPAATTAEGSTVPTPATAGAKNDAAAAAASEAKPGLLSRIRNNPVKSVALTGLGVGGIGYMSGMGAPPPGQPQQMYDPQQQMVAGYR
jgi:hypothetical protein